MRANEFVTERKKHKRKSRYSAYGPGPYGGYGYYAGYSGDNSGVDGGDGGGESIKNEDAMMGKIADSGKIIRILKKAHTVPFSDEKNWLLVDTDPGKGNSGLGIKWIPADTRFEWVRPYRDTVEQDVSEGLIEYKNTPLQDYNGLQFMIDSNHPYLRVEAFAPGSGQQLAQVDFKIDDQDELHPEDLHVEERWRGQGIAQIMYDFVKSKGYTIHRSWSQTDAGSEFWNKHRGQKRVWEQGVAEGSEQKYLWHGSRQKIPMLEPRQSVDTGGAAGSNQNAIYATSDPKVAIAVGGLTTPDSDTAMFPNDPQMVLFSGKIRKGENVYLHKLPFYSPDGKPQFVQGAHDREFYSIPGVKGIKPTEIKAVPVDKYLNLIRKATPADLELRKKNMKEQGVAENFADGKNPQDKGDSKRHNVPTKASVSTLRKVAKQGGRKGQLAHWMANMKSGRSKKK